MGFATSWLDKRALFPEFINEPPDNQTGIIVVIPAYDEPGITDLLNSLVNCNAPECKVEVIVIVNAPADAGPEKNLNNRTCIDNIESWKKENKSFFRLYYFDADQPSIKGWGVGLARKTGMDEALRRFNSTGNRAGVIASLDADCTVRENYLTALFTELYLDKNRKACSIYFEHPLDRNDFPVEIISYIIQYELHLRYFLQGLKFAGFPFSFHTVGSSMAVKASSYLACGGMNRKQAGEDFYFIQKLMPMGGYFSLNSTTVYPSPRNSSRVPFGTGPAMARLMESGNSHYMTYNIEAFKELRTLFNLTAELFKSDKLQIASFQNSMPPGLKSFLSEDEFLTAVTEIKENTSGPESFNKRFFSWFNMFRIVRYLNHVSSEMFDKQPVGEAAVILLRDIGGKAGNSNLKELLEHYRSMERGVNYSSW
jgi:hypothetical protein